LTLPGLEPQPLSRPARSQSLYRLRYPGSLFKGVDFFFKFKRAFVKISTDLQTTFAAETHLAEGQWLW
jgi:hypothetical protein